MGKGAGASGSVEVDGMMGGWVGDEVGRSGAEDELGLGTEERGEEDVLNPREGGES